MTSTAVSRRVYRTGCQLVSSPCEEMMGWNVGAWVLTLSAVALLQAKMPKIDIQACLERPTHARLGEHAYMFSWEECNLDQLQLNWTDARAFCQARCMDLVSLESAAENDLVKRRLSEGKQPFAWTSGHKCNFAGCSRADLQPTEVRGWFWAGSLAKLPPTTNRLDTDWSHTGGRRVRLEARATVRRLGRPQPDNRERLQGGAEEDCLALLNNLHGDGVRWHDIACRHRKPFVCEDSDALLATAAAARPDLAAALGVAPPPPQQLAAFITPISTQPVAPEITYAVIAVPSPAYGILNLLLSYGLVLGAPGANYSIIEPSNSAA